MLVLSRKLGESIRIGDDVVLKVVGMRGGQVRLGIEAPPTVPVVRSELLSAAPPPSRTQTAGRPCAAGSLA
jgi:carbon storage regulator